mgnify:CR=1 FL=1
MGKGLSENAQRAVDIVSDALKDYETVNQTWRNVSWDISNDNPEELYEYYSALIRAREELVVASKSNEELLNTEIYDDICIVNDDEAIQTAKDLASKEGIMCGISSGTNVAAALKLAKKLGPGKTVVTVLPDTAERYFSTPLFN